MTERERQRVVEDLFSLQKPDGGWAVVTMGNWERSDDKPHDIQSSDGYGTGSAIYALRKAGVPAGDPRIRKGIAWLKSHQRQRALVHPLYGRRKGTFYFSPASNSPPGKNRTRRGKMSPLFSFFSIDPLAR